MITRYDFFEDKENQVFQIRSKGDVFIVRFDDENKKKIFLSLMQLAAKEQKINWQRLKEKLTESFDEPMVLSVLQELKESGVMQGFSSGADSGESANETSSAIFDRDILFTNKKIAVLGSGEIFDALKKVINKALFGEVRFHPAESHEGEKNIKDIFSKTDFLIVEANKWNPNLLNKINHIALKENKPWLLAGGIYGATANIGPIFYGKETGCYNCLFSRWKSNLEHLSYFNAYEAHLTKENKSSAPDWIPSGLQEIIASIVIYETLKFLTDWEVSELYGNMITVSFGLEVEKHKLLKNPLCKTCKPKTEYSLSPWLEPISLK